MKAFVGVIFLGLMFIVLADSSLAEGPQNISVTPHNLSTSAIDGMGNPSQYRSDDEDEVCIFCHTPHGGNSVAPLWNRDPSLSNPAAFTHYNSATLSSTLGSVTRNVNSESMLCLSCHDGTISMYNVLNPSNSTGGQPTPPPGLVADGGKMIFLFDGIGAVLGTDLSNDHPISFDYQLAYNDATNLGALHLATDAIGDGVKFFGTAPVYRVECSSCHDPHVNYIPGQGGNSAYQPFLRTSNAASAMCLACHIK